MTVVVSSPEQMDKVKPTDSILFLYNGTVTTTNSGGKKATMQPLEEYCIERGWLPQQAPLPEVQAKLTLVQWLKRWLG